jgi:hypothetical protein
MPLGLVVLSVGMMVGRLMVMVRGAVMVRRGQLMVLDGRVFVLLCYGLFLLQGFRKRWVFRAQASASASPRACEPALSVRAPLRKSLVALSSRFLTVLMRLGGIQEGEKCGQSLHGGTAPAARIGVALVP